VLTVPSGAAYLVDDEITSDTGGSFLVTSKTGNTVRLRSQVGKTILTTSSILTNARTSASNLTVSSVTDPEEDVHHYFDTELGYIVDEGYSAFTNPVTNYQHEVDVNDAKRPIKVLGKLYVEAVVQQFTDLINGDG